MAMVSPRVAFLPQPNDEASKQRVALERAVMMENLAIAKQKRQAAAEAKLVEREAASTASTSQHEWGTLKSQDPERPRPPRPPLYPRAPPHSLPLEYKNQLLTPAKMVVAQRPAANNAEVLHHHQLRTEERLRTLEASAAIQLECLRMMMESTSRSQPRAEEAVGDDILVMHEMPVEYASQAPTPPRTTLPPTPPFAGSVPMSLPPPVPSPMEKLMPTMPRPQSRHLRQSSSTHLVLTRSRSTVSSQASSSSREECRGMGC